MLHQLEFYEVLVTITLGEEFCLAQLFYSIILEEFCLAQLFYLVILKSNFLQNLMLVLIRSSLDIRVCEYASVEFLFLFGEDSAHKLEMEYFLHVNAKLFDALSKATITNF